MRKRMLCVMLGLTLQQGVHASLILPGIKNDEIKNNVTGSALARAGLSENIDDITPEQDLDKLKLNAEQQHEARVWGLTELEEKRYVFLMQNKSKIFYQGRNLTPIDILGLNSRNDKERDHFAELSVRIEAQKVAQNIAWNNAFHGAYLKVVAGHSVTGNFDPSPFSPYAYKPLVLSQGDNLHLFVKANDLVGTIVSSLVDAIAETPLTSLHITIIDADSIEAQHWANRYHIPHDLVSQNRISLNIGSLRFDTLKLKKKSTPLLLLSKNNASHIIDLGGF